MDTKPKEVAKLLTSPPVPVWELTRANFDIDHTDTKKDENPHILAQSVRSHIEKNYSSHCKVFTDGSVLDNGQAGAGFVIPSLKKEHAYFLGKGYSIFTAELIAILMALTNLANMPVVFFKILFCVDSKSVLYALNSCENKMRSDILYEIKFLIHTMMMRGTQMDFCWIPSHSGFLFNDWADRMAKKGAMNDLSSTKINIPLSCYEICTIIKREVWNDFGHNRQVLRDLKLNNLPRNISSLLHKLVLNAFKTKFCKHVKCLCQGKLSAEHILFDCPELISFLPPEVLSWRTKHKHISELISNDHQTLLTLLAKCLLRCPVGQYL